MMRSGLMTKLALGCLAVCAGGSLAGVGLANYTASGSFEFYKRPQVAEWTPPPRDAPIVTSDLAFASSETDIAPQFASYQR